MKRRPGTEEVKRDLSHNITSPSEKTHLLLIFNVATSAKLSVIFARVHYTRGNRVRLQLRVVDLCSLREVFNGWRERGEASDVLQKSCQVKHHLSVSLTPSVLRRIFIFILFIICRFYTASETHVGIEIIVFGY